MPKMALGVCQALFYSNYLFLFIVLRGTDPQCIIRHEVPSTKYSGGKWHLPKHIYNLHSSQWMKSLCRWFTDSKQELTSNGAFHLLIARCVIYFSSKCTRHLKTASLRYCKSAAECVMIFVINKYCFKKSNVFSCFLLIWKQRTWLCPCSVDTDVLITVPSQSKEKTAHKVIHHFA